MNVHTSLSLIVFCWVFFVRHLLVEILGQDAIYSTKAAFDILQYTTSSVENLYKFISFIFVTMKPDNNMSYLKLGLFIILVYCDALSQARYSTTLMSI